MTTGKDERRPTAVSKVLANNVEETDAAARLRRSLQFVENSINSILEFILAGAGWTCGQRQAV
jgi:hypothetical protein